MSFTKFLSAPWCHHHAWQLVTTVGTYLLSLWPNNAIVFPSYHKTLIQKTFGLFMWVAVGNFSRCPEKTSFFQAAVSFLGWHPFSPWWYKSSLFMAGLSIGGSWAVPEDPTWDWQSGSFSRPWRLCKSAVLLRASLSHLNFLIVLRTFMPIMSYVNTVCNTCEGKQLFIYCVLSYLLQEAWLIALQCSAAVPRSYRNG